MLVPSLAIPKRVSCAKCVGKMVKIKETDEKSFRGKIVSLGDTSVTLQDGSKPAMEIPFCQVAGVHGPCLSRAPKSPLLSWEAW